MSPVYQFECVGCHEIRDVESSIHVPVPEQTCQDGYPMMRIFNPTAVHFKTNGFYKTDNS